MKKVLSIERIKGGFAGFIYYDGNYFPFTALKGEPVEVERGWPKDHYPDYETFVEIVTTIDPGIRFLKEPLPIKALVYDELNEAYCSIHKEDEPCEIGAE